jgi:hypothetical protein
MQNEKKRIIIYLLLEFLKFSNFFFIIIQTSFLVRFQTRPTTSKEKKIWLWKESINIHVNFPAPV